MSSKDALDTDLSFSEWTGPSNPKSLIEDAGVANTSRMHNVIDGTENSDIASTTGSSTSRSGDKCNRLGSAKVYLRRYEELRPQTINDSDSDIPEDDDLDSDHSSLYDTDLEPEEKVYEPDLLGLHRYVRSCKSVRVPQASPVLRNMESSTFAMPHYGLGPKGTLAFCVPMEVNSTITDLNLCENWIGFEGAQALAPVIQDNCFITDLNLANNRLGSSGIQILCEAIKSHNFLIKLNLSGNILQDKDSTFVSGVIEHNFKLTDVNLSHNELSVNAGILIGKAIASNDTIKVLDLSWNHFRLRGACAISEGVAVNDGLTHLNLSMNGFSISGTMTMATALTVNKSLQELDLSNNRIPSTTVEAFAACLQKNTALKHLRLGSNPIMYKGASCLIQAISENEASKFSLLDLSDVVVLREFMDAVEKLQEVRPSFKVKVGAVSGTKELEKKVDYYGDKNPLEILLIFMKEKGLRLTDLFRSFDKDQSMSLSKDEFIGGLQSVNTPLSKNQFEELMSMLDKDGDGEVDLKEILNINVEFRDIKMKALREAEKLREQREGLTDKNKPTKENQQVMSAINKLMAMKNKKSEKSAISNGSDKDSKETMLMNKASSLWQMGRNSQVVNE